MKIVTLDRESLQASAKRLAHRDPFLADVYRRLGPPPLWKRPANFATFIRIILEQQVSLASAKSTYERLATACKARVTAPRVAAMGDVGLRELGFTRQKARYSIALADEVIGKRFQIGKLRHQDDQNARQSITARIGLGDWSADVFLLMALCRTDVYPVGDLALVKGLGELDGGQYDTRERVLARAESWRPHRSVATRMIWQLYLTNRA